MNDEIIREVRAIREAHATKFGFNLRAIFEDLKRSEAEWIDLGSQVLIVCNVMK